MAERGWLLCHPSMASAGVVFLLLYETLVSRQDRIIIILMVHHPPERVSQKNTLVDHTTCSSSSPVLGAKA